MTRIVAEGFHAGGRQTFCDRRTPAAAAASALAADFREPVMVCGAAG